MKAIHAKKSEKTAGKPKPSNFCKKCGSHFFTHNSDGSCPK